MATKNRRGYSNPYGSADLGSGVRTTTGGTYRNPRLGIQDTTAFGRGFASTFRMPEGKEKEMLKIGDLSIGSEKGNEWYEKDGVINNLNSDLGVILNNNWKNDKEFGGAAYWQNVYENGNDQQKAMALNVLNGYNQAFGPKDSNFGKYLAVIGDGKLVDKDVSNVYLPGLDGRNTTLTIADISDASQNNPGRFKYAHEEYRGIMRFGLKDSETGQFINVTAMDDAWIEDNIKDRYDIETSLAAGYENFQISKQNYTAFEEGTNLFAGTANEFKVKRTGDYYQTKDIANFDGIAADAARKEVRNMITDDLMPSAFEQMRKKVNNGEFNLTPELIEQYEALNADDEDFKDNYREWRNAAVQDYYTEQFKLKNGSKYYAKGDDGRAIAKTKENRIYFERDYMKTERDISDDDSGVGVAGGFISNISNIITDVVGVGTAGTAPAGWKKLQIDNQKAMEMLERVEKRDKVSYLNLQDEASVNRWTEAVAKETGEDYTREDLYNSLRTKKPSSQHHHIVQIDWSKSALEASPVDFDGTIGSLSGDFARAYGLTGSKKDNFHNIIDKLIGEFGGDIDKYNSWTKGLSPEKQKLYLLNKMSPVIK